MLARLVTFDDVDADRMDEMRQSIGAGDRPEGLEATEVIVLHDRDTAQTRVVLFFEDEEAYGRSDEVLNAMPEGPGRRASVEKYDVVVRREL